MSENQRLKTLIGYLKKEKLVYNQEDFVNKIKDHAPTVSGLKSGKRTLTEAFNKKVCSTFPQVNPDWLLKGIEPMIKKEPRQRSIINFPTVDRDYYHANENSSITTGGKELFEEIYNELLRCKEESRLKDIIIEQNKELIELYKKK